MDSLKYEIEFYLEGSIKGILAKLKVGNPKFGKSWVKL